MRPPARFVPLAFVLFVALTPTARAADPASAEFDKAVVDTLRDVHNYGADLYNQSQDYDGTYRVYEGALRAVRPLLKAHPDVQKLIDDGLAATAKETDAAKRAFTLHETIEKVRSSLKPAEATPKKTEPKKTEPKKTEPEPKKTEPKKTEPEPKKTEPAPMPKKPEPKKTEPKKTEPEPEPKKTEPKKTEPAPMPKMKDKEPPAGAAGATVSGTLTFKGKPLADASLVFVSLDQRAPEVLVAKVNDGKFSLKDVPPGKYAVVVKAEKDGKSLVPPQYATTDTSTLTAEVMKGGNELNFELK